MCGNEPPLGSAPSLEARDTPRSSQLLALLLGVLLALVVLEAGLAVVGWGHLWRFEGAAGSGEGRAAVLCLGDSFTRGVGARPGMGYPGQLEAILNGGAGERMRVVNGGRVAANSSMVRRSFQSRVDRLRPRVVTLMVGAANSWNRFGFHSPSSSPVERWLVDRWRSIRVVKLARLLWRELEKRGAEADAPAAARAGAFWEDWDRGLLRCEAGKPAKGLPRSDLSARVVGLLDEERREEARDLVQRALEVDPGDARLHALLGLVSWGNHGNWVEARAGFARALELSPTDALARVGAVMSTTDPRPSARGLEAVLAALGLDHGDSVAAYVASWELRERRDLSGAAHVLQRVVRLDPCWPRALGDLGRVFMEIGHLEKARKLLEEARSLDQSDLESLYDLREIATAQGRTEDARRWSEELAAVAPPVSVPVIERLVDGGSYERALSLCAAVDPGAEEAHRACIAGAEDMLRHRAPPALVLALGRRIAALMPEDRRTLLLLAKAEIYDGDAGAAERSFSKAHALGAEDPYALFDFGFFCLHAGAPDVARRWAERGRRLAPELPDFPLLVLRSYDGQEPTPESEAARKVLSAELEGLVEKGASFAYWAPYRGLPARQAISGNLPMREAPEGRAPESAGVEAWIRSDVLGIARECRDRGIELLIMSYPTRDQALDYEELAGRLGARFLDVQALFPGLRSGRPDPGYFVPDGHCNEAGYGVIAQAVATELVKGGLVP